MDDFGEGLRRGNGDIEKGEPEERLILFVIHGDVFQGDRSRDRERRLLFFCFEKRDLCRCIHGGRDNFKTHFHGDVGKIVIPEK